MTKKGLLIVVSGPSGAGKGTVCRALLDSSSEILYSVSATTRSPRAGEIEGENYYFLDKAEFERMIERGDLLEWAEVYGNYYGTPAKKIVEQIERGQDVLLEIDAQGAKHVLSRFPEALLIYILPPSLAELEKRIRGRATDSEETIDSRLSVAKEEIAEAVFYRYVIVNENVDSVVAAIHSILTAERLAVARNKEIISSMSE